MIPLYLPSSLARQIEQEGVRAYPNECCGILFGRDRVALDSPSPGTPGAASALPLSPGTPGEGRGEGSFRLLQRIRPVENVFDSKERFHRFSINPHQLMHAERDAADTGQLVLGFYHSHPDHPARPSEFDRTRAWPFYSYVIVSIQARQPVDLTSWVLDDESGTFRRQDILEIEGDQASTPRGG